MKNYILSAILMGMTIILVTSCGKIQESLSAQSVDNGRGSIKFALSMPGIKASSLKAQAALIPAYIQVSIKTTTDNRVIYDKYKMSILTFNNSFVSDQISLPVGSYQITDFFVLDANNQLIYATPLTGSDKAYLVKSALPIGLQVTKDTINSVAIDVLPVGSSTPQSFGYNQLNFSVVNTTSFLVSVGNLTGTLLSGTIQVKSNDNELLCSQSLSAQINRIEVKSLTSTQSYVLTVTVPDYDVVTRSISAADLQSYASVPVRFVVGSVLPKTGCYVGYGKSVPDYLGNMASSPIAFYPSGYPTPALSGIHFRFKDAGGNLITPGWTSSDSNVRLETIFQSIRDKGYIPVLAWEPGIEGSETSILSAIVNGDYDSLLIAWADYFNYYQKPVIIRFGQDMNGNWYPWAGDPTAYQQAYRYVVDKFRARGVTNVVWMFSVANTDSDSSKPYTSYYPGSQYVDCVGVSGYNFGNTQVWSSWASFWSLFHDRVVELGQYNRPIVVDVGCAENGGDKSAWIGDMLGLLSGNADFANVRGFLWSEETNFYSAVSISWGVNSSDSALAGYKNSVGSAYFIKTSPF